VPVERGSIGNLPHLLVFRHPCTGPLRLWCEWQAREPNVINRAFARCAPRRSGEKIRRSPLHPGRPGSPDRSGNTARCTAHPAGRCPATGVRFRRALRLGGRAAVRGPAPGEPTRCILFPNSQTIVNSGPFAFRKKQRLVNSFGREQLFIDVDNDSIRVIDPESHAVDATAPVSRITATPLSYEMRDTETGHVSKTPALTMSVPAYHRSPSDAPTSNGGSGDFRGPAACSSSKTLRPTYSRPPTG
jgi:hypothetical protein